MKKSTKLTVGVKHDITTLAGQRKAVDYFREQAKARSTTRGVDAPVMKSLWRLQKRYNKIDALKRNLRGLEGEERVKAMETIKHQEKLAMKAFRNTLGVKIGYEDGRKVYKQEASKARAIGVVKKWGTVNATAVINQREHEKYNTIEKSESMFSTEEEFLRFYQENKSYVDMVLVDKGVIDSPFAFSTSTDLDWIRSVRDSLGGWSGISEDMFVGFLHRIGKL